VSLFAGGCSAFGHSCFGGHGKRADDGVLLIPGPDSDQQSRLVFPPTAAAGSEDSDDAVIQAGGFGALSASRSEQLVPSSHNLSPFLRQWVRSLPSSPEAAFPRLVHLTNALINYNYTGAAALIGHFDLCSTWAAKERA
jgi:hypothetical protein